MAMLKESPGDSGQSLGFLRGYAGRRRRLAVVSFFLVTLCLYSLGSPVPSSLPGYNANSSQISDAKPTVEPAAAPGATKAKGPANGGISRPEAFVGSEKSIVDKPGADVHPVEELIRRSDKNFKDMQSRQSKTLSEAIATYRFRYGMAPPPHFDKWFEYAKENDYQLIDEFDTIMENLKPYWGVKPAVLRNRVAEALSHPNALIGISVRDGHVTYSGGPKEWQQDATIGMMNNWVKWLPDMDLAFNVNDEPRVQLQSDDLHRLVKLGNDQITKAGGISRKELKNEWTHSSDMNAGKGFPEIKWTRFNEFSHQRIWTVSRMSCPADSPVRNLEDAGVDDLSKTCFSNFCFIQNTTAQSDICSSPSLATSYGFFVAPNAFTVTHDLIPIFTQSKYSTYADILYPSPWYWADKVVYNDSADSEWDKKSDDLYWRGSTTGGFSRWGGWRQQHRQRMVDGLTHIPDTAKMLQNTGKPETPHWETTPVNKTVLNGAIDVSFSHIGQCDPGDCDAQKDFFPIAPYASQQDGWAHKYVLDIDGNAFSGRFYAFLASRSLPFKFAIAREWHAERIIPWVHYVPMSLRGLEWWELLRWVRGEKKGREWAKAAAVEGRRWEKKSLRKKDMEIWFFRLLLEYGRVLDDNREMLGFVEGQSA